jgi:hypothetical protein
MDLRGVGDHGIQVKQHPVVVPRVNGDRFLGDDWRTVRAIMPRANRSFRCRYTGDDATAQCRVIRAVWPPG